ncbi:hypothetical protein [Curtobacterium sp. PhB136]|uniref:hypothetical protein n=1 Tax=Curtobacterium sp. PhB136 TaxID=2485181 RepID=UPI0010486D0E|nr:hypothetical protein [Curtobacterium sp. PhB136]
MDATTLPTPPVPAEGHPVLSLRHVQPRFDVEAMTVEQRSAFLIKWAKRSRFSWTELTLQSKHGLGFEMMPKKQIRPAVPEALEQSKYMVFRHQENLPFVGFKAGDVFHVLWIESDYGDVYDHG